VASFWPSSFKINYKSILLELEAVLFNKQLVLSLGLLVLSLFTLHLLFERLRLLLNLFDSFSFLLPQLFVDLLFVFLLWLQITELLAH